MASKILLAAKETNIHLRWDLRNQICGVKKVTFSFEIEDFSINFKQQEQLPF